MLGELVVSCKCDLLLRHVTTAILSLDGLRRHYYGRSCPVGVKNTLLILRVHSESTVALAKAQ